MTDAPATGETRALDRWLLLVVLAAIVVGALVAASAVARMHRFGYAGDDAIYVQTAWSTAHGRPWAFSIEAWQGAPLRCHLASHADLTHLLYVPLLWIAPRPETPLVVQPLLVALGAVPLFLLARRRLEASASAAAIAGLWLVYLPLVGNAPRLFGVLLAAPILMFALERLDAGARRAATALFLAAFATREDVVLPVVAFLLPLARDRSSRKFALGVSAAGIVWITGYLALRTTLFGEGPDHAARFHDLGGSFPAVALSPLLHPVTFFSRALGPDALRLFALLLLPLGIAPLLSPRHLLAAAVPVVVVGLSSVESDRVIGRYLIPSIPFLFAGVVQGLVWIKKKDDAKGTLSTLVIMLAGALTLLTWTVNFWPFGCYHGLDSHGQHSGDYNLRILSLSDLDELSKFAPEAQAVREELIETIPPEASVSASSHLLLPLALREKLYPFPIRAHEVDYVLVDVGVALWPSASREEHDRSIRSVTDEPGALKRNVGRFVLVKRQH